MTIQKGIVLAAAGVTGAAVCWLATTSRAFVEKAAYTVTQRDGPFEVRDYPALTVASALWREGGRDRAFQRLFGFIARGNERQEKIAMTAPVFIDGDGEEGTMSFVMPRETREKSVPRPTDEAVTLDQRSPERVTVFRFSGRSTKQDEQKALGALREWMQAQGLQATGAPVVAYYDAPFLPPLLQRNEVMLRVKAAP